MFPKNAQHKRAVVLVNTGKEYESIGKAAKTYSICESHIVDACLGRFLYHGELPNGERMVWLYKEEYESLKRLGLIQALKERTLYRKVYCIELRKVYESAKDASRATGISASAILGMCQGKDVIDYPYHFIYQEYYNPNYIYTFDTSKHIQETGKHLKKEIYCFKDGEILKHDSVQLGAKSLGVHVNSVSLWLNSETHLGRTKEKRKCYWFTSEELGKLSAEQVLEYKKLSQENYINDSEVYDPIIYSPTIDKEMKLSEAVREYGLSRGQLLTCIKSDKVISCGMFEVMPTQRRKLYWILKDKFDKLDKIEQRKLKNIYSVYWIKEDVVIDMLDAMRLCNLSMPALKLRCKNKKEFMYFKDYIESRDALC